MQINVISRVTVKEISVEYTPKETKMGIKCNNITEHGRRQCRGHKTQRLEGWYKANSRMSEVIPSLSVIALSVNRLHSAI